MSIVLQEIVIHMKIFFRERQAVFWSFLFPTLLLVLFCSVFGGTPERSTTLVSGLLCINVMSGSLFGTGIVLVGAREQGILRRYKVAPVALYKIIVGVCVSRLLLIMLTTALMIVLARVIFHILLPSDWGAMALFFVVGTLMFSSIAFAVAALSKSIAQANGVVQVLFMPMMFLSGATFPYEFMPSWMQKIAHLLPSTYYVSGLRSIMTASGGIAENTAAMILMAVFTLISVALAVRFFRWE